MQFSSRRNSPDYFFCNCVDFLTLSLRVVKTTTFRKFVLFTLSGGTGNPGLRSCTTGDQQIRYLSSFNLKKEVESTSETLWC